MTTVLACGLGLALVGVGAPAWAADADPTPTTTVTDAPALTAPTTDAPAPPTTPPVDPLETTTPTPAVTDTGAAPTATPTSTDSPTPASILPSGFPTDLIPTGLLPTDLPELLKSDIKLHGVCGPKGVIWTLTNVTTSKIGYAFIDTNLTWGLGVLPGGATVPLSAHGLAVLAIPLNAASGLPYKLPTIGIMFCGKIGGGTTPPVGLVPPVGGVTPVSQTAPPATVATPIVTSNVHFTG
jgi:hypothetical protein